MASDEEMTHLRELLAIYQRRFDALDIQRAHFGRGRVPAEIALDIQETEESIKRIKAKILTASIPQEVVDATGPEAGIDVLRDHVKHLGDQLNAALRSFTAELLAQRNENMDYRARRELTDKAERRRQNHRDLLIAAAFVAMMVFMLWRFGL